MMFTASVVTLTAVVLAYQITLPQIWSGFQLVGDGTGETDFAVSAVIWGAILIVFTTVGQRVRGQAHDADQQRRACSSSSSRPCC